ncbi:hypothetical protein TrCOL_g7764 [Triparma columacea]|uniref:GrpE protein homolog n=1 Tax=Triparma columacea TaxID=722753 RepID=A0A9W7GJS6_9STRA|nr:hypothetical protein TrCOL_g7764 [Triparma columacea]
MMTPIIYLFAILSTFQTSTSWIIPSNAPPTHHLHTWHPNKSKQSAFQSSPTSPSQHKLHFKLHFKPIPTPLIAYTSTSTDTQTNRLFGDVNTLPRKEIRESSINNLFTLQAKAKGKGASKKGNSRGGAVDEEKEIGEEGNDVVGVKNVEGEEEEIKEEEEVEGENVEDDGKNEHDGEEEIKAKDGEEESEESSAEEEVPEEPEDPEIVALKETIASLTSSLTSSQLKASSIRSKASGFSKDSYVRLAAEVDNFKKTRTSSSKNSESLYIANTLSKILPFYDAIVETTDRGIENTSGDASNVAKGYGSLGGALMSAMKSLGMSEYHAVVGEAYSTLKHSSVGDREVYEGGEDVGEGQVVREVRCGWEVKGNTVRKAEVVLCKGGEEGVGGEEEMEGAEEVEGVEEEVEGVGEEGEEGGEEEEKVGGEEE